MLNILELGGVAGPIDSLLENVVAFLPNLLWAGLIFFIGIMVARIVRDLVVTTLQTVDFDKWANRGGVDNVTGNSAISKTIGTIVYVLIAIPVAVRKPRSRDRGFSLAQVSGSTIRERLHVPR